MTGATAKLGLPLTTLFFATMASAQERCLMAEYNLPEPIANEMRPYLICGLIQGQNHVPVQLNRQTVTMNGAGVEACGRIRLSAIEASDRRLSSTMPDASERRAFIAREFEAADRFLRIADRSYDLTVGEEVSAPQCRNTNAQD